MKRTRQTLRRQIIEKALYFAQTTGDKAATKAMFRLIECDRRRIPAAAADLRMKDALLETRDEVMSSK